MAQLASMEVFLILAALAILALVSRPLFLALSRLGRAARSVRSGANSGSSKFESGLGLIGIIRWFLRRLHSGSQIDKELAEAASSTLKHRSWQPFGFVDQLSFEIPPRNLSDASRADYFGKASALFDRSVNFTGELVALYEEVEGKTIIEFSRSADEKCFVFINETRKMVNRNTRNLCILLWSVIVLALWLWVIRDIAAKAVGWDTWTYVVTIMSVSSALYVGLFAWQWVNQQKSGNGFAQFVTNYFSALQVQFKDASQKNVLVAKGAQNQERATEEAVSWFAAMEWIGFRVFFIEHFIRNELFQIRRNSNFYIGYTPFIAILGIVLVSELVAAELGDSGLSILSLNFEKMRALKNDEWVMFAMVFVPVVIALLGPRRGIRAFITPVEKARWSGFKDLGYLANINTVINAYFSVIFLLRDRYKSGG